MSGEGPRANQRYLLKWIAGLAIIIALGAYYWLKGPHDVAAGAKELSLEMLPHILVILIGFLVVYWVFLKRGIPVHEVTLSDESAESVAERLRAAVSKNAAVLSFYENFRDIPWRDEVLARAMRLDIIVCYYDSWIGDNWEALKAFFERGGAMRMYLGDPDDEFVVRAIHTRFPDNQTPERTKEKISNTVRRLKSVFEEAQSVQGSLEIRYVSQPPNYSAAVIDFRAVLLSTYEQFRREKIDSCAVMIDLTASNHLRDFWRKELDGFERHSKRIFPAG